MIDKNTPLLRKKHRRHSSWACKILKYVVLFITIGILLILISKLPMKHMRMMLTSRFSFLKSSSDIGKDGLTDAQREILSNYRGERRKVMTQSLRTMNDVNSKESGLGMEANTPPNSSPGHHRSPSFQDETIHRDQILFWQHVQNIKTSTWGDFFPLFWIFLKIMETKASRPEGDIPLTYIVQYDSPGIDDHEGYLEDLDKKLSARYGISQLDPSKPCSENNGGYPHSPQIEPRSFTEIPHESLCEAAILIHQSRLVGNSRTLSEERFPAPAKDAPPGPSGCFFNQQDLPKDPKNWKGTAAVGPGYMKFGDRIIDQDRKDVRLCLINDKEGVFREDGAPQLYGVAKNYFDSLTNGVMSHLKKDPEITEDVEECTEEEKMTWRNAGIIGIGKTHPRCDWIWKYRTLVWPDEKIRLVLKPNRAMSRALPVANPLHGELQNAFLIGTDTGIMLKSPRIADMSIVAGDQAFRARTVFFSRSEALYQDWSRGPGGGWTASKKPNFLPMYNSGPIQPGTATRAKYNEALTPPQITFLEEQKTLGRKLICYMTSVTRKDSEDVSIRMREVFVALQVAFQKGESPDFAIIISGVKDDISQGIDADRLFIVDGYISFGDLAPYCDVWVNQFGAGSLFWGLFSGKPVMLAPHVGQEAWDKDWIIKACSQKGVCLNCGPEGNEMNALNLLKEGTVVDGTPVAGTELYKRMFTRAFNPDAQLLLNLKNLQRNLARQWATSQVLLADQNILRNSELLNTDSDSMTQLANYILDRVHGVENSHYKLAKLQKMEVHVVEFQEVVRAIVENEINARKPQEGKCILAKHGFSCQPHSRNSIPMDVVYDLIEPQVTPTGCGKKSTKHPCDMCCAANKQTDVALRRPLSNTTLGQSASSMASSSSSAAATPSHVHEDLE